MSRILFRGVCLSACWDTTHTPPGPGTPQSRHTPPEQTPPRVDHPQPRHSPRADFPPPSVQAPPPLRSTCWEIRSTSGRYASYWNAILLLIFLFCFRYQREFGFTISGRPIIVDDIRVRGVGKTVLDLDSPIKQADGPPKVETVSSEIQHFLEYVEFCMMNMVLVCENHQLNI